ncbi:methionyl aminopeptidase [Sarotherodon galilaeus]
MTSVEKRRSGRKSGGHRRHSDGGYSDTSSGGSFLDENDREVCSLTDRAFRSLCIGDEAVYNDSDLSLSSPCTQRDRQLAFSQSEQDREDGEREELKRAARENFSLKVQQYGQDWSHGRMYGGEIHRDPQWEVYGERTQGRISATFQHSVVETSQKEKSLKEERLNFLSNGATELSSQQRKSNSRVSSLIRAFNSERHRDGVGMDDKIREWKDDTSWDKSALMSIQRELSEFSSYQQNFHSGHFPSSGPFSYGDTNLHSFGSDVAAVSHSSASSFMRSSHNKQSMFTQVSCNSNVFIHSEFSPFKVWRDHNRFPFQQGQISGFMHCSEFAKWYETPMYKEPSQMGQPQGHYTGIRQPRSNLAPMISPALPRSTSTSTVLQNASAVEKRCESELAGHYPHRKRSQSVGTNRLPSHRPSTASPTIEMSRRVRDTISSVKALQQKIKMMTEQNITTEVTENQQTVLYRNENVTLGNNAVTVAPNTIGSNTSATPFNISQLLTPLVHAHQEAVSSDLQHYATSPQPVEHPPVQAESRGATPDIRMSTYKSRATSLLFNLKDNRKRVKSTYSPTKFKAAETPEKNKQPPTHEPRDTVIDIPEFPDSEIQFSQLQESSRTSAAMNQYRSPELSLTMSNSQPVMATTGQYAEYSLSDYQRAQMQAQMVHHSGFTGFLPENYTGNKLANGQNLHEDLASFAPYRKDTMADVGTLGGALYTHKPPYSATETPRLNADNNQSGEYLISKPNIEQPFNETVGRLFTKVEKCEQLKHNKHDYSNVSLQDKWRQTNSQDTEKLSMNATISPWKQETAALMEKTRQESHQDKRVLQTYSGCNEKTDLKDHYFKQDYNKYNDNECISHQMFSSAKDKHIGMGETSQRKQYMQIPRGHEVQSLQPSEVKLQSEHNIHINSFNPDKTSAPQIAEQMTERQFVEVKAKQVMAEHIKSHHTQAEVAKVQQGAQVEQPKAEPSRLILAGQNDLEKDAVERVKSGLIKEERVKQAQAEHIKEIKEEKIKGEQTRQFREKQPELAREEQTKAEQTRVHEVRDEPRNITEEARAEHIKKEQGKQVKAERAETEKLKEEHIKTELAKAEQAWQTRIEEAKTEQATEKWINVAQVQEVEVTTEQVKKEQTETEQSGTEKVNVKTAGAEKTKTEHVKEQQTEAKEVKTNVAEVEKIQTDHIKAGSFRKAKEVKASVLVNTEQSTTEISTTQEAKPEEGKAEWAKQERAKAELIKAESMQEMSAKLTAKLTATQLVKSEPDKVKQVKTELAKAKAELAKIKEKMRGEQKEKGRHAIIIKEDGTAKSDVPLKLNITEKENYPKQDKEVQEHQQEETVITKGSGQSSRGSDDYEHLREKYGCTNRISTNKNNSSVAGNVLLNDPCEKQVLSPNKVEKVNKEKSTEEHSPTSRFITANQKNIEEVGGFKSSEVSESQPVYNESAKESKLPNANYSLTNVNKRANCDTVSDNTKDNSVEKSEKYTPVKDTEVSQQRDSDWAKLLPHERKPKAAEHNVGPSKDQHFMPPKSLSHKERALTKQEILTSKIKAHAEKEISAIKEKGCAIRDGFISKNSSKQLAGSQTVKIRQRPPSQEVSKKHESTMPSNATLKPQMGSLGVQMDRVKSVSPSSSATIPVKSAATTTHNIMSTTECLLQNQKLESKPMQNKEQPLTLNQGEQKADHAEISGKPKDGLKDSSDIKTDIPNKKEEDPADATCVKAASSKPVMTEKAESKEEAYVDLAPSLNIVFGQKKEPAADHSLQIMGIMVTVHERKPTVNTGQGNNNAQNHMNEENNSSDLDKCSPNSCLELTERNKSSDEVIKKNNTQETEDQAKFVRESQAENVQETPLSEAVKNNMKMCQERTHPQQDGSTMNIKPQGETQPETLTEKGTITVPAKNKVPGETQPLHHKEDIKARQGKDHNTDKTLRERTDEEKNPQKVQTAHSNENFTVTTVNTGINNMNDAEMLIKQVAKQALKEDVTNVDNQANISDVDGKTAPLLEENKHDSVVPKMLNTSPSNKLLKNENTHGSHKLQYNGSQIRDNKKEDDNVHIDSIAIRVVPPVTETDNMTIVGKEDGATLPFDGVQANKEKEVTSSSCKEKVITLSTEEQASTERSSSDDKHVLPSVRKLSDSLKFSNQQNSNNATSENTQSENEELEKAKKCEELVGESNEQQADGDYFQVQGITETNNEPQYNSITDRDASEGRGLPGLPPNRTAASNETHNEGKIEAFVFTVDQSKRKTTDSSTVQDEDAKRKHWEAEDKLESKQTDGSRKRWNNNENAEAEQANHIRKQIENHSTVSATERQSSRNSFPARESTFQEKPEVKTKQKGKLSTTPEISAIADYARLKVIVSEDREANTFQEYPPNKKEGFFPLIQTRHSRRPVFTTDPQENSAKEKSLPDKTEMGAKANKVPKVLVFPITDKEHQRTGMFKLGEKERQDTKVKESPVDNAAKYTQHKERNHSPKTQTIQISEAGSQKGCQEDQTVCQPNSHSLQPATSSFVVNDSLHPTMEQMHNRKENLTQQMQDGRFEKHQDKDLGPKTDDERTEKLKEESLETQHGIIIAKQQRTKKQLEEQQAFMSEEIKREEDMKIKHILDESRASLAEEERRATQREEERRAKEREAVAIKIKERREKQREAERRSDEERKVKQKEENIRAEQREEKVRMKEIEEKKYRRIEEQQRAAQEEQQRKAAQEKQQKRAAQEEQQRKAAQEEQQRRAVYEEEQRRAAHEEQQRRAAHEEQQRRAAQEEQQRRAAQEEQQRRAAHEEQLRIAEEEKQRVAEELKRRAAQEEQQRRAAQEEQQRRAAQEEQQRTAAKEEQQRRAAQEEQQRRAAQEEQQRRAAQEQQQRRAAQEEQQRRAAQEEQQRTAAKEEQQRRAAQEEQQRRAAQEELKRRAAQEEQQRRAVHEEQLRIAQEEKQRVAEELKRRSAQEEQQRKAAQEEQQRRAVQEEQQRRAAQDEQQRRAVHEEQLRVAQEKQRAAEELKRRAAQEEQQRKTTQEKLQRAAEEELQMKVAQREQQRRAVQEIQQRRRAALIEEQRQIEEKILANTEADKKRKPREGDKVMHISEDKMIEQIQIEEQKRQRQKKEEWIRTQKREAEMRAVERVNIIKEEKQANERPKLHENSQEALKNEMRVEKEGMLAQRENNIKANKREEEKLTADSEKVRDTRREQKRAAQVDALQYYAITSTESETKQRERQLCSPSPSQQRNNLSENESTESHGSHTRSYRPHAPASPAPSLPRSNTSSPALGVKPLMFRVKDNTFRGSTSTKSVKPRFYKSFGEDFRVGSPSDRGLEKREEEQEKIRHSAGTPVQHHTGLNRLTAISESSTFQSASSPQDHSAPIPHYRPYSRRSIAMEEDDSRSLISNMSEDVESFATSAADLADIRGLYDYERPESACSFSSDVSRSLGKPPAVPPKSEKALRRAQRLTTRRMKKELSKVGADSLSGVEKDVSTIRSSSSTEVRSSNRHAMASPHFSSPVSLANAPVSGSSLPSTHTEHQSSHHSFHASPHATGPISIPHTAAVSLPGVSHYATGPASHTAVPKTVAHVPSSPTFHQANHPAPVTQYHVESSYPQAYPLTQRKVLQDPGSGQYFVVDLPVQVKKKTFFDPQTGKYIQLNVRESGKSISQPQPQQTCPQPQMQIKSQQQPFSQTFPAGKPFVLYQGYPQHYQPASINSLHPNKSQVPATLHQNQQPGYQAFELGQNSEEHRYSPEKTPYMDTVNDKDKTYNTIYSTHGSYESFPECDTNSQLAGSSVCENDNSAHSQHHPRDIIAMGELEDFMEVSDW